MSCRSGEVVGMTTRSLLDTGLMYLTGEGTSLMATVGAVDRGKRGGPQCTAGCIQACRNDK